MIGKVCAVVSRHCEVEQTVYLERRLHRVVLDGLDVSAEITLHEGSGGAKLLIVARNDYRSSSVYRGDCALDEYLRRLVEDYDVEEVLRQRQKIRYVLG